MPVSPFSSVTQSLAGSDPNQLGMPETEEQKRKRLLAQAQAQQRAGGALGINGGLPSPATAALLGNYGLGTR